ncbi:hypothetical protein CL632_02180, partial [bacterium]|nr:hypothetical protein [bacterium]
MHKNKNKQLAFKTILLSILMVVFVFGANIRPAHAQLATISNVVIDVPFYIYQIFKKMATAVGSRAYHQALRSVTYRLAQETAVYIASGRKGRKPLVFQKSLGDALTDIGDQVAGKFLVNMSQGMPINICNPGSVKARLKLTIGISKSIQDIDLFPDNEINRDTGKAGGCRLSDITSNFSNVIQDQGKALKDLQKGFDIDQNQLGSFLVLREHVQTEKKKQEEQEKSERQQAEGFTAKKDFVTDQTTVPPGTVAETQKIAQRSALEQEFISTGDIFVDAFQIFANTLAQTYLRRLQQGLLRPQPKRSPGGLLTDVEGSPASRAALLAEYDVFSPTRALEVSGGAIDLIRDMTICPSGEDPNIYESPYHCLLTNDFKQAIEENLSIREAVEGSKIGGEILFPQDHETGFPNFSIENLKRLRFLRVIPIGWEIAAERIGTDKVAFRTLLDCFEDEENPDDSSKPNECPRDEEDDNMLYHLVDPKWVLDLPEHICRAKAFSS